MFRISLLLLLSCSAGKLIFKKNQKTDVAKSDHVEKDLNDKFKVVDSNLPIQTTSTSTTWVKNVTSNKSTKVINQGTPKKNITQKKTKVTTSTTTTKPLVTTTTRAVQVGSVFKNKEPASYALWKSFKKNYLFPSEEMKVNISYIGINAASVLIKMRRNTVDIGAKKAYVFYARAKTASFYKWVYELDDVVESFVDINEFVPLKYNLVQRESKKDIDHIELYDREKGMTHFRYKRVTKDGKVTHRKKDKKMPHFSQDFLSVFFFFRGLPLELGKDYVIPITTKAKTWNMLIKPISKVKMNVGKLKNIQAIKLQVFNKYSGDISKEGAMEFWISDDKYRRFLQVKTDTKIGKVYGTLDKYTIDGVEITQ